MAYPIFFSHECIDFTCGNLEKTWAKCGKSTWRNVIWNFEQVIVAVPSSIGNLGLPFRLCLPHQVKQLHIFHFRTWSMLAPFSRRSWGHHPITVIIFFHFEAATWRSNCGFAKIFFAHKKRGLIWFWPLKVGLQN